MTKKTIVEAARLSKRVCSENGYGHQVLVWPSGIVEEVHGPNECVAMLRSDGSQIVPVARIEVPMTRAAVEEMLKWRRV